ncbi:GntR family transcriptional regulator [Planococcus sp. SIMBA_160]
MQIIISNNSKKPIYEQIADEIIRAIMNGDIDSGEPLPSMRKLAQELQVSVITTKRAYEELEAKGFIHSMVGKGSFVSEQNIELLKERKRKKIEEQLFEIAENSKTVDISLEELIEMMTLMYEGE